MGICLFILSSHIKSNFFEKKAFTTTIPAQFVKRFNCKIIPVHIERYQNYHFKVSFYKPFEFSDINNLDEISPWSCANLVNKFVNSLIEDVSIRYKDKIGAVKLVTTVNQIENWYHENKIEQIVVAYAAIGPNASFIKNLTKRDIKIKIIGNIKQFPKELKLKLNKMVCK